MRTITSDTLSSIYAQETAEVYLVLITISHTQLTTPIRVSSDMVDTVSRGDTFVAYPFQIQLPSDEEGAPPRAQIVIDNVDREITNSLRAINSPASFMMEVVRAADADVVEASWANFQLRNIKGDVFQISGELNIEDVTLEPFPADAFTPSLFPGLFA